MSGGAFEYHKIRDIHEEIQVDYIEWEKNYLKRN
jgi:hypothetical protein